MRTLHLSLIVFIVIIFLGFGLRPVHADNANSVSIQNIVVQPSTVKVGDVFTVTATLFNNSTIPIILDGGTCVPLVEHVPLFTIMLDNHTKIKSKNLNCAGVGLSQILNSSKEITGTSPDSTFFYIATEPGTANVTVTFSYHVINQTDPTQPNIEHTISKSFLFDIQDNNTNAIPPSVNHSYPVTLGQPPLKQFKLGIPATKVVCKQGFQLIIKAEDGSPACVKSDTAQKLIERGWATKNTLPNNSTVLTKILSQVFPTNTALSVGEPSVKGYLISNNGMVLPNKQINVIIDNATFENGVSIENILVGKTFTDQDGCFYLADWNQDAADRFQNDMVEKTPRGAPTDLVSIKAVFSGDSKFQGSSNATKFIYYTVAVPIIRPAISAFLVNGSHIVLEKGKSYNFTDYSTWGESLQLHTLSIEMKNLPCGIYEKTREISVANNQTQAIIPIELRVEKTAPIGNFTTYISVNNQALEPINLEIK